MQLLPPLSADARTFAREKPAGVHLPYARHLDDATIETRDGQLLQIIRIDGLLFETADTAELNYRTEMRDAMLRTLSSSRFAVYHHVVRRRADVTLEGEFADPFSRQLDQRWRERLALKQLYVNDLFLTVVRRPPRGRGGLLDRLRGLASRAATDARAVLAADKRALEAATQALIAALGSYSPRLLTAYSSDHGDRSEPLEFLAWLFNADRAPRKLPRGDLGHEIPARRISFGDEAFELAPSGSSPRRFGAIVSIKDYPGEATPGMFDELYRLPFDLTVSQSFAFVERREALGRMNLALRRMRAADDEALSLRDELIDAKDGVAAGRAGFGEHHASVTVYADQLDALDSAVAEITATLADLGLVAVREDVGLEPAFWAQFPGNFGFIARRAMISTANFAGFASLHNFPAGKPHGNHWGEAVTLFETTAAGPYFFNFHQQDLGNFTVIGPSGSGKTVVLNFLLAQARKYAPRIIFFDKDRGAELFVRSIGGQYDRLRAGSPSGLNPLQLGDTPVNRQFLADWLGLLAGGLSEAESELAQDAIDAVLTAPRSHRRLRHLASLLRGQSRPQSGDLASRLRPWWGDGPRAWLFDNAEDRTNLAMPTVGFDMTAILDDPALRTPALFYLFHRVEERLDGTPAIIVVDEGWKALDDDVFVRRIKDWEKTIRKRNGIIGFATQSAEDALSSRIAGAIVEQAATQIFMLNPKARAEDYIGGFALTPHEFEIVRGLPDNSHCFLVKHGNDSVVVRLDLTGERDLLTILSGREATVRLFDELVEQTGPEPEAWLQPLLERAP